MLAKRTSKIIGKHERPSHSPVCDKVSFIEFTLKNQTIKVIPIKKT